MKLKKILISTVLATTLITTAFATDIQFNDINGHWAEPTIEKAVTLDLFSGKAPGVFAPDDTMTRGEFVTVVMRAVAPEAMHTDKDWMANAYEGAIDIGILDSRDLDNGDMTKPMQRQEMAFVLANAMEYTGESLETNISKSRIPDYGDIGTAYNKEVLVAYSNGLLAGTDTSGTFSPEETMTRAQGATVLVRLADATDRSDVKSDAEFYEDQQAAIGSITITEGEVSERRNAKEGDIFVKADGTRVTLTKDEFGVVGAPGVAADKGMIVPMSGGTVIDHQVKFHNYSGDAMYRDSLGNGINSQEYQINGVTGVGHWDQEWSKINKVEDLSVEGAFEYQLSQNNNFMWSGTSWINILNGNLSADGLVLIKTANGL